MDTGEPSEVTDLWRARSVALVTPWVELYLSTQALPKDA